MNWYLLPIGASPACQGQGIGSARLLLFACGTTALAYVSRASLAAPRSHGFSRFLAWESMLGLAILNFRSLGQWFGDPLGPRQLVSWVLLFG